MLMSQICRVSYSFQFFDILIVFFLYETQRTMESIWATFNFSCFDICYSPEYLVSRMGSLAPQLRRVHEIWRDEVGHYAHIFGKMYREPPKIRGAKISLGNTFRATGNSILAINEFQGRFHEYLVTYRARFSIFRFFLSIFSRFSAQICPFSWILGKFWPKIGQKLPKKNKKLKNGLCTSLDTHEIYPETDL